MRKFNTTYKKEYLRHIAFPLGGIGAGMFCVQGNGMLGNFSINNEPNIHNEPNIFSALCIKNENGNIAKIIEGQIPFYKIFGGAGEALQGTGNGLQGKNYGLPRFKDNDFTAKFPFASLNFYDDSIPVKVEALPWSPFVPLDSYSSSQPLASIEYTFSNTSNTTVDGLYYFNATNFMKDVDPQDNAYILRHNQNGFILMQKSSSKHPKAEKAFCAVIEDKEARVNTNWFKGGWFDTITMQWNDIKNCKTSDESCDQNNSPGASISVPIILAAGETKTICIKLAWYIPESNLRFGPDEDCRCEESCCDSSESTKPTHKPWYSEQYKDASEIMEYFCNNYGLLKQKTQAFTDSLYSTSFPNEVIEAITANLSILKSPTVLRQTDGRLWCWEGCCDSHGCCHGSCTHVWNYAQALCHLFPDLERTLRVTEFEECQNNEGHQEFRASLPIRQAKNTFHAAADGQLGGIMKMYREWRISGGTQWIENYWQKIESSLNYCINTWDKKREGVLREPHHNTYDIEFWGADGMCTSFYLGALKAATLIGEEFGKDVSEYKNLYQKGKIYMEETLFNGEYFYQEVEWKTLFAKLDLSKESEQCKKLIEVEGPKYQYGKGCLSDGVLGAWLAKVCGLGDILDPKKVKSHLISVYKYNLKHSLIEHENPQRPGFAIGNEGGLLLCTWPNGEKPSLPFVYSDEVWTGIEYQVASHLIMMGEKEKGLDIVRTCRSRYDGSKRNPFSEYECGHWYARALASYSLFEALSGIRYDMVSKTLFIQNQAEDFASFLCTSSGFATVGIKLDKPFIDVISGQIEVSEIIIEN